MLWQMMTPNIKIITFYIWEQSLYKIYNNHCKNYNIIRIMNSKDDKTIEQWK